MDVLAHCRVYPISNFYHAVPQSLTLPSCIGSHCVSFVHLIEHNFKFTPFKRQIWNQCIECSVNDGSSILVIDIISEWKKIIQENSQGVHYMNSTSICNMEGLQNFLMQLQASPLEALQRCLIKDRLDKQISGIIIDNLSYLAHDLSSYSALIKILKQLRRTFGCWILTIGYGLEYYDGVENSTSTPNRTGALTKLPASYINEMDVIILRETADRGRTV
ncbi:hypothetical protein ZYGR_0H01440 [Zygosaccharomyces rouxii]|uniref:ZYRO0B07348p n=2 Tax=Zygosaccharomyces rouxii TaxID=4956 RepID=C5DRC4_ZYGRC|nr:uncharacterized protein ZYRO0B07348g [Zygosaccharomyces rouxii]GAV47303.1 hypothetical protein ZYGR_0H01440 [Zygosaccharomyces rouxii]CAR26335.1 ZYRO0B07348p [Zygosaccharomyces rouxii]